MTEESQKTVRISAFILLEKFIPPFYTPFKKISSFLWNKVLMEIKIEEDKFTKP